jgi:hypothetical protein
MLNLVRVFSEKSGEILFDNQMRSAQMRIIFFAGKGGVGKTSTAAATGIKAAEMGLRTVVMSLDVAHSLADIFDLEQELMDQNRGTPVKVKDNLWIQELDIQEEIQRHWGDIHKYLSRLLWPYFQEWKKSACCSTLINMSRTMNSTSSCWIVRPRGNRSDLSVSLPPWSGT